MNDRRTVARPARAERSKLSTLSAPASSLRIARMADVSRTRRFGSGISAAIPSPVVEQSTYGAALPRAAEGRDRIVRNRDDSYGISFDLPFEGRVRRDAELAPDRRRDGHLAARRDLRTHGREFIMLISESQDYGDDVMSNSVERAEPCVSRVLSVRRKARSCTGSACPSLSRRRYASLVPRDSDFRQCVGRGRVTAFDLRRSSE